MDRQHMGSNPIVITAHGVRLVNLAAQGLTNKEIAKEMKIVEGTVKNEFVILMDRVNAKNRTHLCMIAVRQGWIK